MSAHKKLSAISLKPLSDEQLIERVEALALAQDAISIYQPEPDFEERQRLQDLIDVVGEELGVRGDDVLQHGSRGSQKMLNSFGGFSKLARANGTINLRRD